MPMKRVEIDCEYLVDRLWKLLEIPSPSGFTDSVVHFVYDELQRLGVETELTRRGGIRATLPGQRDMPGRAVVGHVDTLGAMVRQLKDNGRLSLAPVGTWSARFAEGARGTVVSHERSHRGTILPLKASGHIFADEVDTQPVSWDNLEMRIDAISDSRADLQALGFRTGDFIAIDPDPEFAESGHINARHLDDKAGVAAMLAAIKAVRDHDIEPATECLMLFTVFEEVGSGASATLHGKVAELVAVDNATPGPGQNARETGVTICMMDSSGPFDWHLTRKLLDLCEEHQIPHQPDIFRYYRCDAASAIEAGNEIRTALVGFGVDSSHGYERTHVDSLRRVAELLALYMQSEPVSMRDRFTLAGIEEFPEQPIDTFERPVDEHHVGRAQAAASSENGGQKDAKPDGEEHA